MLQFNLALNSLYFFLSFGRKYKICTLIKHKSSYKILSFTYLCIFLKNIRINFSTYIIVHILYREICVYQIELSEKFFTHKVYITMLFIKIFVKCIPSWKKSSNNSTLLEFQNTSTAFGIFTITVSFNLTYTLWYLFYV